MIRRDRIALTVVVALGFALVSAAASIGEGSDRTPAPAEVGGPPTVGYPLCDDFVRPCGKQIVIGSLTDFAGRLEVVAFSGKQSVCIFEERVDRGSGSGGCGPTDRAPEAPFEAGANLMKAPKSEGYMQIGGVLRPDVDSVDVIFKRRGKTHRRAAYVSQIHGALARRVGATEPFGVVELAIRGCIPSRRFRLVARDDAGALLGRSRLKPFVKHCRS